MIQWPGTIADPLSDEIGGLIRKLREYAIWTKEKREAFAQLRAKLDKSGYKQFDGHPNRYGLGPLGDSYLLDVPDNRRGFLSAYRGRLVRLVVVSQSRFDRGLMVGVFNRDLLLAPAGEGD